MLARGIFEQRRKYLDRKVLGQELVEDFFLRRLELVNRTGAHPDFLVRAGLCFRSGRKRDQLLNRNDLRHRRAETVVDDRTDIEGAGLIKHQNALGDVASLVEGDAAPADIGQAIADRAAVVAAQPVAALAADDQQHDPLASRLDLTNPAPCLAQDRGVEAAGETSIRGRNDDQMRFFFAGADEQRRRAGKTGHAAGQRGEDALHALRVRTGGFGLLLRAAQPRSGNHFHRGGDLLCRPDAANA